MLPKIDLELDAFLNLDESLPFAIAEVPDAVEQFIETAKLAGQVGWQTTDGFSAETSRIEKHTAGILKHSAPARSEWDAEIIPESQRLEKRFMAGIHSGKKAARVEKSANGMWVLEYDERGELIRGYQNDEAA